MKNKKAWVRVVEVFIAILLLIGIALLIVTQRVDFSEDDFSKEIFEREILILRSIQLNDSLRNLILEVSLPTDWEDFESSGLGDVRREIVEKTPGAFNCTAKICALDDSCILNKSIDFDSEVYVEVGFFSADIDTYSPRQLKLFCWEF